MGSSRDKWCVGVHGVSSGAGIHPGALLSTAARHVTLANLLMSQPSRVLTCKAGVVTAPGQLCQCSGCHNKISQTGRLKQQRWILSQSGGWKFRIRMSQGWLLLGAVRENLLQAAPQLPVVAEHLCSGFCATGFMCSLSSPSGPWTLDLPVLAAGGPSLS